MFGLYDEDDTEARIEARLEEEAITDIENDELSRSEL